MKRGLIYTLNSIYLASNIFLATPTYAGEKWDKFKQDPYITRSQKLLKESRKKTIQKYGEGNEHEASKNIAKKILKDIPGAGKMIEFIDRKNKQEGFYKKLQEQNKQRELMKRR